MSSRISYIGTSSVATTTGPTTLHVPKPAGVTVGSLILVSIGYATSVVIATPPGWTGYSTVHSGKGSVSLNTATIFGHLVVAADGTTYAFTVPSGTWSAFAVAYDVGQPTLITQVVTQMIVVTSLTYKSGKTIPGAVNEWYVLTGSSTFDWLTGSLTPNTDLGRTHGTGSFRDWTILGVPNFGHATTHTGTLTLNRLFVLRYVAPPAAPTLQTPVNGAYVTSAGGLRFQSKYLSQDTAPANAYAFRWRLSAATTYQYWNGTAAQSTIYWNASTVATGASQAVSLPDTLVTNGNVYVWSMAFRESWASLTGPFATNFTVNAASPPALTVTAPTGTVVVGRPTVVWGATPSAGESITKYHVKLFTQIQYTVSGFTPGTASAVWDTGTVAGNPGSIQVAITLQNSTSYRAYVQVAETGTMLSAWAFSSFTTSLTPPLPPTITATATTAPSGYPLIKLTIATHNNLLTATTASGKSGVGKWVAASHCTVTVGVPPIGGQTGPDKAIKLQATATAYALAKTSIAYAPVVPGRTYTVQAKFTPQVWYTETAEPATSTSGAICWDTAKTVFYIIAGGSTTLWSYQPVTHTWATLAVAPATFHAGGMVYDPTTKKVYVLMGNTSTSFYSYTPTTNTWTALAAAPAVNSFGALTLDTTNGKCYAIRGSSTTTFWSYTPTANTWTSEAATPATCINSSLIWNPTTAKCYAIRSNSHGTFWSYTPTANTWTTEAAAPNFPTHNCLAFQGKIYGVFSTDVTTYTSAANTWTVVAHTPFTQNGGIAFSGLTKRLYISRQAGTTTFASYAPTPAATCHLSMAWLKSTGTLVTTQSTTSAPDGDGVWTRILTHVTAPSTSAQIELYISIHAVAAQVHWISDIAVTPGAVTGWSQGGCAGNSKLIITRHYPTTTGKTFYLRGASTLHRATIPATQFLTLYDFECVPTKEYHYTGRVVVTTTHVSSSYGASNVASVPVAQGWWMVICTTTTSTCHAQPITFKPQVTEQATAHLVLGQAYPNVVASVMGGQDGTATFETFSQKDYGDFQKILQSQQVVFMQNPYATPYTPTYARFGPQSGGMSTGYGVKAKTGKLNPSSATAPHHNTAVTWVAQPRPPV